MTTLRLPPLPPGRGVPFAAVLSIPLPRPSRLARPGAANGRARCSPMIVRTLRRLEREGYPYGYLAAVARAYGVHPSTIWRMAVHHAWTDV